MVSILPGISSVATGNPDSRKVYTCELEHDELMITEECYAN